MCCGQWDVPVDKITYQRYREFSREKLGALVARFVLPNPTGSHDNLHAAIHRTASGQCPFFGEDRLCGIQKEYGPALLGATCSLYPRALSCVNGNLEGTLTLSCPEAARLVLLNPDLTALAADLHAGGFRTDNFFVLSQETDDHPKPAAYFPAIRSLLIEQVRDRTLPVWQRLLIVASFCSRLDTAMGNGRYDAILNLLGQYRAACGQGPYSELESLPHDLKRRMELVLALSRERSADLSSGQRFRETFWDFVEGIGEEASSSVEEDLKRFRAAEKEFYEPLLHTYPALLENYLVNFMLQTLFPYGRAGSDDFMEHSAFEAALLLAIQFSWVTTLLVGAAAHQREAFSIEHVVKGVQSFTRAVEHVPWVMEDALMTVRCRGLDDLVGMSILLRS